MGLEPGWGHATSGLNVSRINEAGETSWSHVFKTTWFQHQTHSGCFDSPRESSDCKSPSQNKHIFKKKTTKTHKQPVFHVSLIKEGMNKNNPLPMRAFGKGSSWRWHRALVLFARSSLIGLRCLVGVSWRSGRDARATWKRQFFKSRALRWSLQVISKAGASSLYGNGLNGPTQNGWITFDCFFCLTENKQKPLLTKYGNSAFVFQGLLWTNPLLKALRMGRASEDFCPWTLNNITFFSLSRSLPLPFSTLEFVFFLLIPSLPKMWFRLFTNPTSGMSVQLPFVWD